MHSNADIADITFLADLFAKIIHRNFIIQNHFIRCSIIYIYLSLNLQIHYCFLKKSVFIIVFVALSILTNRLIIINKLLVTSNSSIGRLSGGSSSIIEL